MSYILEAIKKAESERGNTRLYVNNHVDNSHQVTKKIPWVAIAIFINAAILLAWIGIQLFPYANNDKNSNGKPLVERSVQQARELVPPLVPKIVVDEQPVIIELENIEPALLNNESEPNTLDKPLSNSKPSFVSKPAKVELLVNKVANVKNISTVDRKIVPAKVESLPVVENLLFDEEDPLAVETPSTIELPAVVQNDREISIIENPNVPSINELPYELQQRIPDLSISVHIYNVVKEARKVRVNGKLLHQGDAVNDDLIIQEITTYGVIFNYSGELFKMTLR